MDVGLVGGLVRLSMFAASKAGNKQLRLLVWPYG